MEGGISNKTTVHFFPKSANNGLKKNSLVSFFLTL